MPLPIEPITLKIIYRDLAHAKIILAEDVSLTVPDNVTLVMFYNGQKRTKVPEKFITEVEEAGTKASQSKWRSTCLNYHIALSLEKCAFTLEHQQIAQQKMNRTWAQFRVKRAYKPIQSYIALSKATTSNVTGDLGYILLELAEKANKGRSNNTQDNHGRGCKRARQNP
ncbi:hypothetical protein CY34DRAFT_108334 [Suillus luteus UH-Slu-Lm8-n1]|uniref:Uncharacterized protein n=1 Tax=Suillus luteus UH-Slu-Lm8-n1 TaxID=930992 RepID=A0A0D0AM92_9AGAM|nr:hypothetical protein CY34DRAFT_108334 [Suillus luteus UH-Slu-Lm8-n1]